jgi:hypothetical protein
MIFFLKIRALLFILNFLGVQNWQLFVSSLLITPLLVLVTPGKVLYSLAIVFNIIGICKLNMSEGSDQLTHDDGAVGPRGDNNHTDENKHEGFINIFEKIDDDDNMNPLERLLLQLQRIFPNSSSATEVREIDVCVLLANKSKQCLYDEREMLNTARVAERIL